MIITHNKDGQRTIKFETKKEWDTFLEEEGEKQAAWRSEQASIYGENWIEILVNHQIEKEFGGITER